MAKRRKMKMKDKVRLVTIRVTEAEFKRLKEKASGFGITVSSLLLDGSEKEILFHELTNKYNREYPPPEDSDFDTTEMLARIIEKKKKIAAEFVARAVF